MVQVPRVLVAPVDRVQKFFHIYDRGSTWSAEFRAGIVLFMTSAYILFLNPLILSGASAGTTTGMPSSDVVLATAISTGLATGLMGVVANYPWVVSVQLGTNTYFVTSILQPNQPCGFHPSFGQGTELCAGLPCTCNPDGSIVEVGTPEDPGPCYGTTAPCLGTAIPFEQALGATFLEGIVFLLICFTGMRSVLLRCFPKSVLMAGACGIGLFIAFVGIKDMGVVVGAPYPTLLKLVNDLPYLPGGWGSPTYASGVDFNSCVMYEAGPPFSIFCPWLAVGGLIFTGILVLWNINGAFIYGILFVLFIGWIKFPDKIGATPPGMVPPKVVESPSFIVTAGSFSLNWGVGGQPGKLVEAFFTFLYLDFIGSSITFVSMGTMCGILDEHGNIPKSNIAFISDGFGTTMGGILGSSALTTYVESASAVREGGRTGVTACVCSVLFFLSVFFAPLFSSIPDPATGPILVIIGILIFMSAVNDIDWKDLSEAGPAFICMIGMPFTSNIAYGVIGGMIAYIIVKFVTYQLYPPWQKKWPGYALHKKWTVERSMKIDLRAEGWVTAEEAIARRAAEAAGIEAADASPLPPPPTFKKDEESVHSGVAAV